MNIDLSGKQAIVVGGGGAIGLAISKALAEAGANVTVLGIRLDALDKTRLVGRKLDLTSVGAIRQAVDEVTGESCLDVLVHAAGVNISLSLTYRKRTGISLWGSI